ncbi:hypothetical protein FH972_002612 [Carpinus fangiana]|uniref:Uncharacterized protein n=1 Tax=Carpinus fangiana TaxID=176857 RepID=A0A5N6QII2_9ROSI|nr:hypothetical protein FH972_002612 [Carpinus fangiana]
MPKRSHLAQPSETPSPSPTPTTSKRVAGPPSPIHPIHCPRRHCLRHLHPLLCLPEYWVFCNASLRIEAARLQSPSLDSSEYDRIVPLKNTLFVRYSGRGSASDALGVGDGDQSSTTPDDDDLPLYA